VTIYLKYRLERAAISDLNSVCLSTTGDSRIVLDIADELRTLFPGVLIDQLECRRFPKYDMVVIAHLDPKYRFCKLCAAVRRVLPSKPYYFGFYEYKNRRLVITSRYRLLQYVLRIGILRISYLVDRMLNCAVNLVKDRPRINP
jgi:hypothetical protein